MLTSLLQSNLIQLLLTAAAGAALYLVIPRWTLILSLISWTISLGIIVSALFTIGEVNIYSDYYRRAFFYFGDEITTVIIFLFMWSLIRKTHMLSAALASSMLLSGGKISLILLIIATALYLIANNSEWKRERARQFLIAVFLGIAGYSITNYVAISLPEDSSVKSGITNLIPNNAPTYQPLHRSACSDLEKCFRTQIGHSLQYRYFSAVAGLWMTMQGGYSGKNFPNTRTAFADLMMKENPWGINEKYGLNHLEWSKVGLVQTPYLAFGAGYGPVLLIILILFFSAITCMAYFNIKAGEHGEASLYSIAFATIVIFNHTQSWLKAGSLILVMLGFCASHIILSWLSRQHIPHIRILDRLFPAISGQTERA
ncbi:MAG: hypothetical protein ACRBBN_17750 [Methyloligellaceae bacterium]